MPTVEIDTDELRTLASADNKGLDALIEDLFALGLENEGQTEDGDLVLEFGPDRLDRLSVEGVARSLRTHYGVEHGVQHIETEAASLIIDATDAPSGRPYAAGFIAKGVNMDEAVLDSLIQLQEKLHATLGRNRSRAAIGVHRLDAVVAGDDPVYYEGVDNGAMTPLGKTDQQPLGQIIDEHEKGKEYGGLVDELDSYPVYQDSAGIFSFPPIINGARTEVTETASDLFVELTGTDQWTLDKMATILSYALADRGATIEPMRVEYETETITTPSFDVDEKHVTHDRIEDILGIHLDTGQALELFQRSGLGAVADSTADPTTYHVTIPPYRVDIRHPRDLIDDIGRAYGFNNMDSRYPRIGTRGSRSDTTVAHDTIRDVLTGIGCQDVLTFHLISADRNYSDMRIEPTFDGIGGGTPAVINQPYSDRFEQLRTWLLPSLLTMLSENTHRAYPQHISETALVGEQDTTVNTNVAEEYRTSVALAGSTATYDECRRRLGALGRVFGVDVETTATTHPTFIDGRTATIVVNGEDIGIIGEVHPEVLNTLGIEEPVAAFEVTAEALGDRL